MADSESQAICDQQTMDDDEDRQTQGDPEHHPQEPDSSGNCSEGPGHSF
jgi:hypothetical protein